MTPPEKKTEIRLRIPSDFLRRIDEASRQDLITRNGWILSNLRYVLRKAEANGE